MNTPSVVSLPKKDQVNPDLYPCKVWYENGIIYVEYVGEINLTKILAIYEESLKIIDSKQLDMVPFIGIADKITSVKLKVSEYSQVISAYNIAAYASGAWFVGVDPKVKIILKTISSAFLSNKLKFVETLADAQNEVRKMRGNSSLLDESKIE